MATEQSTTMTIDGLATAWLKFHEIATLAGDTDVGAAMRLAADIANSLSDLRSAVSEIIIRADSGKFDITDAVLELRGTLEDTAKVPESPVLTAKGDLLVVFSREGEDEHRQTVEGGERALKVALLILSLQDELRAGDRLVVEATARQNLVERGLA